MICFTAAYRMVIASAIFEHKQIHKMPSKSSDGSSLNQIDHTLVDARHILNIMDVRSRHGANIDSDHFLVVATCKDQEQNFKCTENPGLTLEKYNCEKFKDSNNVKQCQTDLNIKLNNMHNFNDTNEWWVMLRDTETQALRVWANHIKRIKVTGLTGSASYCQFIFQAWLILRAIISSPRHCVFKPYIP